MHDVFISYSRKDAPTAEAIRTTLEQSGISCFMDTERISGGESFLSKLSSAILQSRIFLFLASEESYQSEFTRKELLFAVNNLGSSHIFPLIIDEAVVRKTLEFLISDIHWRKLSSSYQIDPELLGEIRFMLSRQGIPISRMTQTARHKKSSSRPKSPFLWLGCLLLASLLVISGIQFYRQKSQLIHKSYLMKLQNAENELERLNYIHDFSDPKVRIGLELHILTKTARQLSEADSLWSLPAGRFLPGSLLNRQDSLRQVVVLMLDSMSLAWTREPLEAPADPSVLIPIENLVL